MSTDKTRTSRRAFFLKGGATLGAGVAATAGAAMLGSKPEQKADGLQPLQQQLAAAANREAIRQLQLTFASRIERSEYSALAELFDEDGQLELSGEKAAGRAEIAQLFMVRYAQQTAASLHGAYRPNAQQQQDQLTLDASQQKATALFHVDVALGSPLRGDSTVAQMARLQGQVGDRRWESGRIEAQYVKKQEWKLAALRYLPA